MATTQYRTVETQTLKGVKTAERLYLNGWTAVRVGLFSTVFMKRPTMPIKKREGR